MSFHHVYARALLMPISQSIQLLRLAYMISSRGRRRPPRGISSACALQHDESLVSPPELFQDLGSLDLRFLNASTEELLKAMEKTLGRPLVG